MVQNIVSSQVNKSMFTYMTTFGVDDWLFVANLQVALFVVFAFKLREWLLVAIVLHFVLMLVTKLSPRLLECYFVHMRQANRYWPGRSPLQTRGKRPAMFAPAGDVQ